MAKLLSLLIALLIFGTPASACIPFEEELQCPVCETSVEPPPISVLEYHGRDLRGEYGSQQYATCSECLYSAKVLSFSEAQPELLASLAKQPLELPPGASRPVQLWASCHLAAQLQLRTGASPDQVLSSVAQAAWALRDQHLPFDWSYESPNYLAAQRWLETPLLEMNDDKVGQSRRLTRQMLASQDAQKRAQLSTLIVALLWAEGEYELILNQLPELEGLPANMIEAQVRAQARLEKPYLEQSLSQLKLILAGKLDDKARFLYLAAEVHRRLGHLDAARAAYLRALAEPGLEPRLRAWIPEQMALLERPAPPSTPWVPAVALALTLTLAGWRFRRARMPLAL